jgi:hypothetical protein
MQAKYPLKIQAIRSKNQQARRYVYFPLPLAAAIGLEAGEEVQWEPLAHPDGMVVGDIITELGATASTLSHHLETEDRGLGKSSARKHLPPVFSERGRAARAFGISLCRMLYSQQGN